MNCSMPGFPVHHQLPELAQTHIYPNISSSTTSSSSCPQSSPAPGFFLMSQLFPSGGQSIGASATSSVRPMNIQDRFPLGLTSWISLQPKGLFNSLLQHHSSKPSICRCSAFFIVQISYPYITTGKNSSFD